MKVKIPAKTITVHLKAREIELPDNFHSLGGIARAKKLSPERRKEISQNANKAKMEKKKAKNK